MLKSIRGFADAKITAILLVLAIGAVASMLILAGGSLTSGSACSYDDAVYGKAADLTEFSDLQSRVLPDKAHRLMSEVKSARWKKAGWDFGIDRPPQDAEEKTVGLRSADGSSEVELTVWKLEDDTGKHLWLEVEAAKLGGKSTSKKGYYTAG